MAKTKTARAPGVGVQIALGVALMLVLILLGFVIFPLTENADAHGVTGSADWMGRLPDETPLSAIALPGTHDSATTYAQLAWFSRCQSLPINEQLEAGYRYLDIRLGDAKKDGEAPRLMHGFTECRIKAFGDTMRLDDVLGPCYAFLRSHPTEMILFCVKHEYGDSPDADMARILDAYVQKEPALWLETDTLPTLGQARGKLVLLRRWEDEAGLGARGGVPFLWENQSGSRDVTQNIAPTDEGSFTLWVQDRYEYELRDKWSAYLAGLQKEIGEGDLRLSFLSTKGSSRFGHPWKYAQPINEEFLKPETQPPTGWVIMDFGSPSLAARVYNENFA